MKCFLEQKYLILIFCGKIRRLIGCFRLNSSTDGSFTSSCVGQSCYKIPYSKIFSSRFLNMEFNWQIQPLIVDFCIWTQMRGWNMSGRAFGSIFLYLFWNILFFCLQMTIRYLILLIQSLMFWTIVKKMSKKVFSFPFNKKNFGRSELAINYQINNIKSVVSFFDKLYSKVKPFSSLTINIILQN